MDDKLFIIAVGGTGMRCLEAFVHLCAAGMMDNRTIEILTIDTDNNNGNKGRVEELINKYNAIKTSDPDKKGGESTADTFFSAKLNLFRFYTDYSSETRKNYKELAHTRGLSQKDRDDNADLSELFFDKETVQEFPLNHGYRAQTHLGSMLIYHAIIEAAIKAKKGGADVKDIDKELQEFLILLNNNANNARVFVFGSVFGGTGASSIPVIPVALREALGIISGGNNEINFDKVKFASTLLTDYFSFSLPDDEQKKKEKVIADSANFALNSQAAMAFYESDLTVRESYKFLYHIGWPASSRINYSESRLGEVITGGSDQRNPCHFVELLAACAAFDFFMRKDLPSTKAQYLFRSVEETDGKKLRLTGESFVGPDYGPIFEEKLGSLLSLSHLLLSHFGGAFDGRVGTIAFRDEMAQRNFPDFLSLSDEQGKLLDDYLKTFAYSVQSGRFNPGWIFQIKNTIDGQFIFTNESLSLEPKVLANVDPGGIYNDNRFNWKAGLGFGSTLARRMDKFLDKVKDSSVRPTKQQGESIKEKFIATLYNAITKSQSNSHLTGTLS